MLALLLAAVCPFVPNAEVGFYQWAALMPAAALHQTVDKLHELKAGLIRLYIGPRYDYEHVVLSQERVRRLPSEAIVQPVMRAILEDPCIPTIILSVYTGRDYGAGPNDVNLHRSWSEADTWAETSQLMALAEQLYATIGDQNKTVIIANSEADARLLEIGNYTGSLDLAVANITKWQRARYQAIARARLRHPYAKLRLLNAFEISLVNLGMETSGAQFKATPTGAINALRTIVPNVPFDLLSYSAYESINSPYQTGAVNTLTVEVGGRLTRDLATLRRATAKPIMIGELGFSRWDFDNLPTGGVSKRLESAFAAISAVRPAYTVLWQAFDGTLPDGAPDGFGLLEPSSTAIETIQSFVESPKPSTAKGRKH